MTPKEQVLKFFAEKGKGKLPADEQAVLGYRYLDEGLIDSLGIVMMISQFEDELGIAFSPEDMQSYEFQTIGGVVGIVERLVSEKK
jgi:acyl carrier protein